MSEEEVSHTRIREAERTSVTLSKLEQDLKGFWWLAISILGILTPVISGLFYVAFQSNNQLNLTSERVQQIQRTIDSNQITVQKQLDGLSVKDHEIELRLLAIEQKRR
jgi:hypothetical protein